MFNIHKFLSKLLLAVCLSTSVGVAAAGPIYRVSIDTASLGTGSAFLDLYFRSLGDATDAVATVSNLTGALNGAPELTGSITGILPGPLAFSSAEGGAELVQAVTLGGVFSFDLHFLIDSGTIGTTFGWALFNEEAYLGADGDLGTISLNPDAAAGQQVSYALASQLATVTMIPEPSTFLLLLLAGTALLLVARRRS